MRKNRYIVDFGGRTSFSEGRVSGFYRCAETHDAYSKGELAKRLRIKRSQIVFMRHLGN